MTTQTQKQEDIRKYLRDKLHAHAHLDDSKVEITVTGGRIVLAGTVESEWAKRCAQEIAEAIAGVSEVDNRLRLEPDKDSARWSYEERVPDDHQQKTYNQTPYPGYDPRLAKTDHPAEHYSEYREISPGSDSENASEEADYREPDKGKYR